MPRPLANAVFNYQCGCRPRPPASSACVALNASWLLNAQVAWTIRDADTALENTKAPISSGCPSGRVLLRLCKQLCCGVDSGVSHCLLGDGSAGRIRLDLVHVDSCSQLSPSVLGRTSAFELRARLLILGGCHRSAASQVSWSPLTDTDACDGNWDDLDKRTIFLRANERSNGVNRLRNYGFPLLGRSLQAPSQA